MVANPQAETSGSVPDFWTWLREQSVARHGSPSRAGLAIGIGRNYITGAVWKGRTTWPLPDRLALILDHFSPPAAWRTDWEQQAQQHWGAERPAKFALLAMAGLHRAETIPCAARGCANRIQRKKGFQKTHCREHAGDGHAPRKTAKNALAKEVRKLLDLRKMSQSQFSRRSGQHPGCFHCCTQWTTWHPTGTQMIRMATILEVPAEQLSNISRGTREDHHRSQGHRLQREVRTLASHADRAASAARRQASLLSEAHRAISRDDTVPLKALRTELLTQQRQAHPNAFGGGIIRGSTNDPNVTRAKASLFRRFCKERRPSPETIHRWVIDGSQRLNIPPARLLGYWKPILSARGLQAFPARRHAAKTEQRCRVIRDLDAATPRTKAAQRPPGWWEVVEREIRAIEGDTAPTYDELRVWTTRHARTCPDWSVRKLPTGC